MWDFLKIFVPVISGCIFLVWLISSSIESKWESLPHKDLSSTDSNLYIDTLVCDQDSFLVFCSRVYGGFSVSVIKL